MIISECSDDDAAAAEVHQLSTFSMIMIIDGKCNDDDAAGYQLCTLLFDNDH